VKGYVGIALRKEIWEELKQLASEEDLNLQQLIRRMIWVYKNYRREEKP
jgi:predicted DNA-binding ribbon-helix-helix protein